MRKLIGLGVAIAAIASFAAAANAAVLTKYDFSYTFSTGETATGSFLGTGDITAITDISDVALNINGNPISGVSAYSYNGYQPGQPNIGLAGIVPGGAIVSSNPANENFFFATSNYNTPASASWFYIIPWNNGGNNQVAVQGLVSGVSIPSSGYNGLFVLANFSVQAVPETSTWMMMIVGFGVVGVAMRRRERKTGNARMGSSLASA